MAMLNERIGVKSRRIRKAHEDPTVVLARSIGLPEQQLARGFAVVSVANHTAADQRHSVRSKEVKTIRILYPDIVDRWLAEGGPGFDETERAAIEHCRGLWHRLGCCGSLVANLDGDRGGSDGAGWSQHEALTELAVFKDRLPHRIWDVFENVVRWGQAAGHAGSEMASNAPQRQAAAKACVGFAASMIATWRRF